MQKRKKRFLCKTEGVGKKKGRHHYMHEQEKKNGKFELK